MDIVHRKCSKCKKPGTFLYGLARCDACVEYRRKYCADNAERLREIARKSYHKCVEQRREYARKAYYSRNQAKRLSAVYGLTDGQYEEILAAQGGGCAICGSTKCCDKDDRRMAVDHCHETGVVRGLLCRKCNLGLGFFGDSVETLLAAALYLERSRRQPP